MIQHGLEQEVFTLLQKKELGLHAAKAIGYSHFQAYFNKSMTYESVLSRINIETRQYGKKQRTWLRSLAHHGDIQFLHDDQKEDWISTILQTYVQASSSSSSSSY